MYTGAKIIRDGLILQYDVANNKCFRGEPTVNLLPNPTLSNDANGWSIINYVSRTPYTFINKGDYYQIEFTRDINISGTDTYFGISQFINVSPNTLYTYSVSIDAVSSFIDIMLSTITNSQNYIQLDWYNINTLLSSSEITINNCDRISLNRLDIKLTATSPSTTTRVLFSCRLDTPNLNIGQYCRFYKPQLEQKDHSTPFTPTSRGTTVSTGGGLIDLSNNGNNGEIVNNILYDSSNCGSLVFDGVDNYISLSSSYTKSSFSISLWYKASSFGSSKTLISTSALNITLLNDGELSVVNAGLSTLATTLLNQWYNVVYTTTTDSSKIYINGILINSNNTQSIFNNESIFIGRYNTSQYFNGNISIVQIYDGVLNYNSILKNYRAFKTRYGLMYEGLNGKWDDVFLWDDISYWNDNI